MPFSSPFFDIYDLFKRKLGQSYSFNHAGDACGQQNMVDDIIEGMLEADVILVDLTGQNSNVMYEMGIAHTLGKKTIIINQDDFNVLPFDIQVYRVAKYSLDLLELDDFICVTLKNLLDNAVNNTAKFSNPVKNYFDKNDIILSDLEKNETSNKENNTISEVFNTETSIVDNPIISENSDFGILDLAADAEDNLEDIAKHIFSIKDETVALTKNLNNITNDINKNSGGSGTASYKRKLARSAAKKIGEYGDSLKKHILEVNNSWNTTEISYCKLLESNSVISSDDYETVTNNVKGFLTITESSGNVIDQLSEMKKAIQQLIDSNIEKELTKSSKLARDELSNFINFIYTMDNGIKNITEKSQKILNNSSMKLTYNS